MTIESSRYLQSDHLATEIARQYSNETGQAFYVVVGDFPGWDIQSISGSISVEIKCESTPIRTGNVAIEYFNTDLNKTSGILASKANLWLHLVLTKEGYLAIEYDADVLRKLVIENGVVKSNGRNSLCKIISLEVFKKSARRVFPFSSRVLNNQNSSLTGSGDVCNVSASPVQQKEAVNE